MKNVRSLFKFVMPAIVLGVLATAADAGATLKVNWVGQGNTCDNLLTL